MERASDGDEVGLAIQRTRTSMQAPVTFALFAASRALHGFGSALLLGLGLHPGQELIVMQLLDTDEMTATELCDCLGLDHSTISRSVVRMEDAGLVSRRKSAHDRRASMVTLTPKGRALEEPLNELWSTLEAATTALLDSGEPPIFMDLTFKVEQGLQSTRERRDRLPH